MPISIWHVSDSVALQFQGKQSERYLQNRLTNNIKFSSDTKVALSAALTPQGKVQGIFTVVRQSPEHFTLLSDGGKSAELISDLLKFKVTERVECLESAPKWSAIHLFGELSQIQSTDLIDPEIARQPELSFKVSDEIIVIAQNRFGEPGLDLWGPADKIESVVKKLVPRSKTISDDEAASLRIKANRPIFPFDITTEMMLLEVPSMEGAVSDSKGCYVGQEVIAKVQSLGKAPRILAPVKILGETNGTQALVSTLQEAKESQGKLVTISSDGIHAFALVRP